MDEHKSPAPNFFERVPAQRVVLLAVGLVLLRSLLLAGLPREWNPFAIALVTAPLFFVLIPVLALRAAGDEVGRTLRIHPLPPRIVFWLVVLALAIIPPVWALGSWNVVWFPPPEEFLEFLEMLVPDTAFGWVLALFTAGIVIPLGEEIVFRGMVQQASRRMIGGTAAAITTGLLFALLHAQPWLVLGLGLIGVVLGLVYEATGSLLAPLLVHGIYNATVLGLQATVSQRTAPDPMLGPAGAFLAAASGLVAWAAYTRLRPVRDWTYLVEDPIDRP